MVQVHHGEDRTSDTGFKPCGVSREGYGEASAEGCVGQPLNHEMSIIETPPNRKTSGH